MAVAISAHPDPAAATGEVAGELLERLTGTTPGLIWVAASAEYLRSFPEIVAGLRTILRPRSTIGTTVSGILGFGTGGHGKPDRPNRPAAGLAVGAFHLPPDTVRVRRLDPTPDAVEPGWLRIVYCDPGVDLTAYVRDPRRTVAVLAAGIAGRGLLAVDGDVHADGGVAIDLSPAVRPDFVVAPAYVPLGPPRVVTRVAGAVLREVDGRSPLGEAAAVLGVDPGAPGGPGPDLLDDLLVGFLADGADPEADPIDFLPHRVLAADSETGSLTLAGGVPLGAVVRFLLRDAAVANAGLRAASAAADRSMIIAAGADTGFAGDGDPVAGAVGDGAGSVIGAVHAGVVVPIAGRPKVVDHAAVAVTFGVPSNPPPPKLRT